MVRIRLRRVGKRKQPHYRVVVADSHSPRDGRFIEVIGQYNPLTHPSEIEVNADKALEWLRKGAKPSDSVIALLKRTGVWTTFVADKGPAPKKVKKHKVTEKNKAAAEAKAAEKAAAQAAAAPAARAAPAAPAAPSPETAPAEAEAAAEAAPAPEAEAGSSE
jgi:small subunit ribosomal protein S16